MADKYAEMDRGEKDPVLSWLESQSSVMELWLDRLIADGDPDDMVSLLHRQAAWLDMAKNRVRARQS